MKILVVPDSFKGSLSSKEVCDCIKNGLRSVTDSEITTLPFADGGEGFAECLSAACNGVPLYIDCTDLYGKAINAATFTYGNTAVIECAAASGLQKKKDVMNATSYGTGELIKAAVLKGFNNIVLGLGGSGCCDGGAGALCALGVKFKDFSGEIISLPTGSNIGDIYGADFRNIVKPINFTYACDVDNPYYGKNGAAFVFAKQKGATDKDIVTLDNGLKMLNAFLPKDVGKTKGAGAAGGLCGCLYSVYGGAIKSGFDILCKAYDLETKISQSDLIITGEGKTDSQSLMGKLPYKIASLCKKYGKKCAVISGIIEGVSFADKMISLTDSEISAEESMKNAAKILTDKSKLILQ